jgi:iron(III) transport system ATP-binding protein
VAELRCEGLAKSYAQRSVLRDVDLVVPGGTLTAILGASGSGKTTLLRIVMGLLAPDAGKVKVGGSLLVDAGQDVANGCAGNAGEDVANGCAGNAGQDVAQGRARKHRRVEVAPDKRAIGYVAQEAALFPHLSAGENIGFGLSWSERRSGARVAQMLDLVGLDQGYRERRPQELSGGEQRRVALARALAPRPRLVLLDEPFSGLDAALRVETREAVMGALASEQATALLVTHDQAEALSMGREVAVLRDGTLVQRAAPALLYREPVDLQVASFVGEAVILTGEIVDGRAVCALGELELRGTPPAAGTAVHVMVRPEQVCVLCDGAERDTDTRSVRASVLDHTCYGPDTVLRLALADSAETIVKARTLERELPAPGERVGLAVHGPAVAYPVDQATTRPPAEIATVTPA